MSYIGSTPTTQSFIAGTDYFNGNGSTVNFTLSRSVNSVNDIEVIVNNVEQIPSGYSVSGTTLTFSAAPSAGTSNVYVRYLSTTNLSLAIPSGTSATFNTIAATTLSVTGVTTFAAGTAALPAITTTGDTNTGIFFPAADTIAFAEGGAEAMRIDSAGFVGIGTTSPATKLEVFNSAVNATFAPNTLSTWRVAQIRNDGTVNSNSAAGIAFVGRTDVQPAGIVGIQSTTGGGAASLAFLTVSGNATSESARIDSSGNLLAGGATAAFDAGDSSNSSGQGVNISKSAYRPLQAYAENGSVVAFKRNGNNGAVVIFARGSVGEVGSVSVNTTATAYNTSSDYRLKNTIAPMTGALAKVALLKPCTYKWNLDGSDGQGFIAHELDEVVPQCVSGEKDAVEIYTDEDGNEQTRPKYQGIDTSFLVATLTAAIQEQQALITALTTRITALENNNATQ